MSDKPHGVDCARSNPTTQRRARVLREAIGRALLALAIVGSWAVFGYWIGFLSPWFGVTAAFCLLGLLDLAAPYVRLPLPRHLREIREWELRRRAYRALGVFAFGALLRGTNLRMLNRRVYLSASSSRDVVGVGVRLREAEAAHFWDAVATLPYLVVAAVQGRWSTVAWVSLFDLVTNLYPILHLRSVRGRLDRLGRKVKCRSQPPTEPRQDH